jgi:hypothetical protein
LFAQKATTERAGYDGSTYKGIGKTVRSILILEFFERSLTTEYSGGSDRGKYIKPYAIPKQRVSQQKFLNLEFPKYHNQ